MLLKTRELLQGLFRFASNVINFVMAKQSCSTHTPTLKTKSFSEKYDLVLKDVLRRQDSHVKYEWLPKRILDQEPNPRNNASRKSGTNSPSQAKPTIDKPASLFDRVSSVLKTFSESFKGLFVSERCYKSPEKLRKRKDVEMGQGDQSPIRAKNLPTRKWADVKSNRLFFSSLSEALTEISSFDPKFDKETFLGDCEKDFIPNILEAIIRGKLDVLEDWCYEEPYRFLSGPIKKAQSQGLKFHSRVLDLGDVELVMGSVCKEGLVLVVSFWTQQVFCMKDGSGNVVEGDENEILQVNYVWTLCRDLSEPNPKAAWRLLDITAKSSSMLL